MLFFFVRCLRYVPDVVIHFDDSSLVKQGVHARAHVVVILEESHYGKKYHTIPFKKEKDLHTFLPVKKKYDQNRLILIIMEAPITLTLTYIVMILSDLQQVLAVIRYLLRSY